MSSIACHSSRLAVALLGVCAFFSVSSALGDDWVQFRGPNRDDVSKETGLLQQWPAGGPALAWQATGLGGGFSGVSVAAGRIYTMGEDATSCYVRSLDEATGKVLWSAKVGAVGGGNGHPGPRCTPAAAGSMIVALGQFGDLVCLEAGNGKEVWRTNLAADLGGAMMSGWGYSESPLVDGNRVICTPGGAQGVLAALDLKTGKVAWRSTEWTDKAAYSSVVPATIGGVKQYIQLTGDSVAGVNPIDGKLLWKAARSGRTAVIPTPIVAGNLVYVASGYGAGSNLFRVESAGGKFTAQQVYASKEMVNHHGGVVKVGDYAFGFSDKAGWSWQDFTTGALVSSDQSLGKGSVTFADGRLYLRLEGGKGTVVLLEPSAKGWSEKGRFDQPDRSKLNSWPHPVVANGRLFIRDQDVLFAYDVKQK
jgi:outer membrane protein assembly factor BamB